MSWRVARSLEQLRAEVNARFPGRDLSSDGSIGDTAHQARKSDHNPNSRGVVQARDFDENDASGGELVGDAIWEMLLRTKPRRLKYAIYEGKILSSYPAHGYPAYTPRPFDGNPHPAHIHVSVQDDPALYDDPSPWGLAAPANTGAWFMDRLVYARKRTPDAEVASLICRELGVAFTTNVADAREAQASKKVKVYEVGGHGAGVPQDVKGATWVKGENFLDTIAKVTQSAKGW